MKSAKEIPVLSSCEDWIKKAEFELSQYMDTGSVYDLANCLLTLNAIPEWINKSKKAPEKLKYLAGNKIEIMKSHELNIEKLKDYDNDQLFRLVRLFCNHAKHATPKNGFVQISMSAKFPLKFPIRFDYLSVGNTEENSIEASKALQIIVDFWRENIFNSKHSTLTSPDNDHSP